MIVPVILSGGSGTRLWPISRKSYPKQFIKLVNEKTLFQESILRLPKNSTNPVIICNEEHRFLVSQQLLEINKKSQGIFLEPEGKNTAPAIALASLKFINAGQDPTLIVLSADHIINNIKAFHKSIKIAERLAKNNKLVALGIIPSRAETGFGYIKSYSKINDDDYQHIESFIEKPSQQKAEYFLECGNYLWNSGMFIFNASTYLNELEKFDPEILNACKKSFNKNFTDSNYIYPKKIEFLKCPEKSIDYAVMERTKKGVVVPLDAGWSDVGSWSALWEAKKKDVDGNLSEGDVILEDVNETFTFGSNRLVAVSGVSNLVIVDTKDALLVTNNLNNHSIKNLVKKLKIQKRAELDNYQTTNWPWGTIELIDNYLAFQVELIVVYGKAKLALNNSNDLMEHWVVIKGNAFFSNGNQSLKLIKNESTSFKAGEFVELNNNLKSQLEIIRIKLKSNLNSND